MSIERCVPNTMYSATGLTNGPNAYDAPSVAYPASGDYTQSGDTTYAIQASSSAITFRYAYLYGFSAKQAATWTSAALWVKYDLITAGDDAATQWNSNAGISYCYDFNSGTYTGTWVDIDSATGDFGSGIIESGAIALTLGSLVNSTFAIRIAANGHAKTGVLPDYILGSLASVRLYHAFIDGVYTSGPTVASLNTGTGTTSPCNIGSSYNIVGTGFTGATAVSINGVSASYSVTNSTTISVTIPMMNNYGTSKTVGVTVSGVTGTANVAYINTPSVSVSPTSTSLIENHYGTQFTATTTNLANTAVTWSCTGGSITTGGIWTAPTPTTHGQAYTITATANGNSVTTGTATGYAYFRPTVSISGSLANGSYALNGSTEYLTWSTTYSTSTTTNFGSSSTAWTALNVGSIGSNTSITYMITPNNPGGSGYPAYVTVYSIAAPSLTNNGPVLLNTNVTLTPTFAAGVGVSVAPGSWGAWTTGVGQAISLPCNRGYTLTQTGIGTAYNVSQAKLPTTPTASISISQVRQIIEGPSSTNSINMNHSLVRTLSGTQTNAAVSFSNLSNKYLSTAYIF